jgi:hypothetical protein
MVAVMPMQLAPSGAHASNIGAAGTSHISSTMGTIGKGEQIFESLLCTGSRLLVLECYDPMLEVVTGRSWSGPCQDMSHPVLRVVTFNLS